MSGPAALRLVAEWTFWLCLLLIVYTYFLYPVLIALWARLRPRPVARADGFRPTVTCVVAAHDELANIECRVSNLLGQVYPHELLDVVVVSDGSTDGTDALLKRMVAAEPRLRALVDRANAGKAVCVNDGVAIAGGEIVVFADARQRFEPDVVARLVENFADPAVGSVSGELMLTDDETGVAAQVGLYWRYEKFIRDRESRAGSMLGATGAIYAVRRALYRPLPPGTLLDDFMTPMRIVLAGHRAIFDGRARAYDKTSERAGQEFRRKARTLAGNFQAFRAEPGMLLPWANPRAWWQVWSHKLFRLLVPWALLGMLVAALYGALHDLAAGRVGPMAWLLAGQIAFHGLALVGWRQEARRGRIESRPISLCYTFEALNLAAAVGLISWLRGGGQPRAWRKAYAPDIRS